MTLMATIAAIKTKVLEFEDDISDGPLKLRTNFGELHNMLTAAVQEHGVPAGLTQGEVDEICAGTNKT